MPATEDASLDVADASDPAETPSAGSGDSGPALPPEVLVLVFRALNDLGLKATLLECSVASRGFWELAFPVLYSRIDSKDVKDASFLIAATKHGALVREMDLDRSIEPARGVAYLALSAELRVLRMAMKLEGGDALFAIISTMSKLETLVLSSAMDPLLDARMTLPPRLRRLRLVGPVFPSDGAAFAERLDALENLECLEIDTWDTPTSFFEHVARRSRVVSAIRELSIFSWDLSGAHALFESPSFSPHKLGINFNFHPDKVELPSSLSSVRGIRLKELKEGETSLLPELLGVLPRAEKLLVTHFRPLLDDDKVPGVEVSLMRNYGTVALSRLRVKGARLDGAELAMWRRLAPGSVPDV
ncbi:hypothetical protein DFJ74DRAFT_656013 [Hyaloraphidium curvatum]|nr:hypothetical protein DFJ74DRAFT_656013 [Hyaloraphidium curvatum]